MVFLLMVNVGETQTFRKLCGYYRITTAIADGIHRSDFFVSEVALLKLLFAAAIRSEYTIYIYI